jgi:hypothetical protein
VKAETAAANKAGAIPDANKEGSTVKAPAKSTKSRADVKKETAEANKGGALDKPDAASKAAGPVKSDKARADVKKDTAAANKAGAIPDANKEGSTVKAPSK